MLIVDKPMPSRCLECFTRLSCERYTQEIENVVEHEELKAILPNDKCLIHGEPVRCGECKRAELDEEPQNDGEKYVWCKYWCVWKPEDGFCDVGYRKDGAK